MSTFSGARHDRGLETSLESGLEIEARYFAALFDTEDRKIGMSSFRVEGPGKAKFIGRRGRLLSDEDAECATDG